MNNNNLDIQIQENEELINKRNNNINNICDDIDDINSIMKDLTNIISYQKKDIDNIENNMSSVENDVKKSTNNIIDSYNYQSKTYHMNKYIMIGGLIGLSIPLPILGLKLGLTVASYSSILGLGCGYIISKKIKPTQIKNI